MILSVRVVFSAFVLLVINLSIGNNIGYANEWQADHYDKNAINWSVTNISFLKGRGYLLGEKKRTIATFDHSSGGKIGSHYFFFDVINPDSDFISIYGEWHPAFSLSNLFNQTDAIWKIDDILLVGEYDYGSSPMSSFRRYYYGIGVRMDFESADYFNINFLYGGDPSVPGDTEQISVSWGFPFKLFRVHGIFSGYVDYIGSESYFVANIQTQPQLLVDIGRVMDFKNKVYFGIEYQYWHNKFGLKGITEKVPQLILSLNL